MLVRAIVVALLCGLSACAGTSHMPRSQLLPASARAAPDRYLVVTVRNDSGGGFPRAGATPRGYDAIGSYRVSANALRQARSIAADYGLEESSSWPIAVLGVHCIVYRIAPDADREQLVGRLAHDRRVESVEPLTSFSVQASEYNDPYAPLQRNLDQMSVHEAQEWSQGQGVRVALVDTGVDTTHPDLLGRVVLTRNFVDTDANAFRSDTHGTAMAGVIAAVPNNHLGIVGIAPGVQLYAYKACWRDTGGRGGSVCNTFTLAEALSAAIDARVDVVNLSLAGPPDPLLARIVRGGVARGIIFVGAVAPEGGPRMFPTGVDGVIAVDSREHRPGVAALGAPGNEILTLVPGAHYDFESGSSLATAQVSGVVALLLAQHVHLRAADLRQLLARTSSSVPTSDGAMTSVNACAALAEALHRGGCGAPGDGF